jgi:hypothetical protein
VTGKQEIYDIRIYKKCCFYKNKWYFSRPAQPDDRKNGHFSANIIATIKIIFFLFLLETNEYYSKIIVYEVYSYVSQEYSP